MQRRGRSWLAGGLALIACGIVGLVRSAALGTPGANTVLTVISDVVWAGAILILAVGVNREASVVARRPLGLAAGAVVALWPLTDTLVGLISSPQNPEQAAGWQPWMYVSMMVTLMSGLTAAVQVARAHVVPVPWNRAPLWAFGIQTVVWVVPQLVNVASPTAFAEMAPVIPALGTLGFLTTTLGLGLVAVLLGGRSHAGTVVVFESSSSEQRETERPSR